MVIYTSWLWVWIYMYYYNICGLCPKVIMLIQRASCIFIPVSHRNLCLKAINQVRIKLNCNIIKISSSSRGCRPLEARARASNSSSSWATCNSLAYQCRRNNVPTWVASEYDLNIFVPSLLILHNYVILTGYCNDIMMCRPSYNILFIK